MFYSISVIDYLMMGVALVLFFIAIQKIHKITSTDWFAIIFILLLCFTLVRNSGEGATHFIKMASAFILYFIGRGYYKQSDSCGRSLVLSQQIVVFSNLVLLLLGGGYIIWGSALTFKGFYFYKSDFSIAMLYALSSFIFLANYSVKRSILDWILVAYLILVSNTRMAMLIYFAILVLWILYRREQKKKKLLNINLRLIGRVMISLVIGMYLIIKILNLPVFEQFHYLSFSIGNISDIMGGSNTQGRNVIWYNIMHSWSENPWYNQVFGVDFVTDQWSGFDSHNSYIKILYSTGIAGLVVFFMFIISFLNRLNQVRDRSLFFFSLTTLLIFMMQSISQSSIDFTQMTWIWMFFAGCSVSHSLEKSTELKYNDPLEMRMVRYNRHRLVIRT